MLGMYDLLPYLKGWEYKLHEAERNVVLRGQDPITVLGLSETGWVLAIVLLTTDAYGTLIIEGQGADLETETLEYYPEAYRVSGYFMPDPVGYLSRYLRPDPDSTAGLYQLSLSNGYSGSPLAYVPSIVIKLHLPTQSTQDSAYIYGVSRVVAITDKEAFIKSLRRIQKAKADLWIDPALLAIGPAEFSEGA